MLHWTRPVCTFFSVFSLLPTAFLLAKRQLVRSILFARFSKLFLTAASQRICMQKQQRVLQAVEICLDKESFMLGIAEELVSSFMKHLLTQHGKFKQRTITVCKSKFGESLLCSGLVACCVCFSLKQQYHTFEIAVLI